MTGFFDTFQDTSGGSWVGKDEKDELIANATPFTVQKVHREDSQYGERYVATVDLDGEERLISFPFGTVDSRDRMLAAMEKWCEDESNARPVVYLERVKRSIVIRAAAE